jgi:hypothetical protein
VEAQNQVKKFLAAAKKPDRLNRKLIYGSEEELLEYADLLWKY